MFIWNHNTIYHKSILKHLPISRSSALDIGSGLGTFSNKLSNIFHNVNCLEPDSESIELSKKRFGSKGNINYINSSFESHNFVSEKYDFISAIASIHHMDFKSTLLKMNDLLKPGGKLVILGLFRESTLVDLFISLAAILPNLIMNTLFKNDADNSKMIITRPQMTLKEIKKSSKDILGNFKFKRHLFWRYSIIYERN